jgi:hypothetical protein
VKWQPSVGAEVFLAFIRRADEGTLSRLLVETTILVAVARSNGANVLRDAANISIRLIPMPSGRR